nr:CPPV010 hypothetical protein [Cooks petrelpox virus]
MKALGELPQSLAKQHETSQYSFQAHIKTENIISLLSRLSSTIHPLWL